jgi:hypothetical protein
MITCHRRYRYFHRRNKSAENYNNSFFRFPPVFIKAMANQTAGLNRQTPLPHRFHKYTTQKTPILLQTSIDIKPNRKKIKIFCITL